jgi:septal ring factor EnvC (AmiA/AmiB activator)
MTAYIVCDTQGNPVSIGEVLANPLPAGLAAVQISDADFTAIRQGLKRATTNGVLVDTNLAAQQTNTADLLTKLAQLRSDAATATAALQTIRNRTSPTAAQVAADVKTEAQIMQQVIQRLLAIVLYATGDLTDNTGT